MKKSVFLFAAVLFAAVMVLPAFTVTEVRITGWPGNDAENKGIDNMVMSFNATHPDIKVIWEPIANNYPDQIKTRLAGGTAADLLYVDVNIFEEFAKSGSLLPLDAYMKDFAWKDIPQPLIDGFTYNKRIYGVAKDFSTLALYFNKAMFDKYKIPYPKDGITYSEFYKLLNTLKSKGVTTPLVVNADFNRLIPFINAYGGKVVDDNLRSGFGDPNTIRAVEDYVNMVVRDKVGQTASSLGAGWEAEAFGKEQVAMIMSGPWCIGYLRDTFPNVFKATGIVEMPKDKKQATMIYTVCWSVNKNTKNRAASIEVLKYLVTEGQEIFMKASGVLGSSGANASRDTDPIKKAFYAGAKYGTAWRIPTPSGNFSKANDEINRGLTEALAGKLSAKDFCKQVVAGYDQWIE